MLLVMSFVVVFCIAAAGAQTNQHIAIESRSTGVGRTLCGSCALPDTISSSVWLAANDEPGTPILLSGTIYKADGVTPDSGVTLFLYQTDAGGYYHRPKEDVFHPKLYGWLVTGKDGRYEIHSVEPAPEILAPGEPAHIHVHVFGNGIEEHFLHEFWFTGDGRIPAKDVARFSRLGTFSPVVTLTKGKDGISRGTRDIRIRPAARWKYEPED